MSDRLLSDWVQKGVPQKLDGVHAEREEHRRAVTLHEGRPDAHQQPENFTLSSEALTYPDAHL